MRDTEKLKERLQIPLMYAFRDAFEKRDSAKLEDVRVDGERVIAERSSMQRRSANEDLLKKDLGLDLAALVDTIDLGSTIDLDHLTYVKKSVLNYGLSDLTHLTLGSEGAKGIASSLKLALLQHEPRLSAETLAVEQNAKDDEVNQRVRFKVHAALICKPLDIPIDFVAEVDPASGKVIIPRTSSSA